MLSNPLYIAEKPDMAAKIAKNLPGPHKKGMGFIETGAGTVTWAIGHLLEQAAPEDYQEQYAKWNYADLPIVPQNWMLKVTPSKSKQVSVIRDLLKKCSDVVNAGDPGREGQLIVDEILDFLKNKKPVWRLILNSLDAPTVQKALANLQPNAQYQDLYQAALGRQRADWLVGMNLTRAYTILGRKSGYQGVLSVGRVQTPTLAIVVRREEEIRNFVPQRFWTLHCVVDSSPSFVVKYIPPKEYTTSTSTNPTPKPAWLDDVFRVCDESQAKKIVSDVLASPTAKVVTFNTSPAKEKQPLPFKLSNVQSRMNAKMGVGVEEVLAACQSLYEKGYASYPRTDCNYLPPAQLPDAPHILATIGQALPALTALTKQADPSIVSPAWDEKKLGEHHAIIPTAVVPNMAELSPLEKEVYDAIAKRYLAQFFPECEVDKTNIEVEAGGHLWGANGRVIRVPGWRAVYASEPEEDEDEDNAEDDSGELPSLNVGDTHPAKDPKMTEKFTTPPPRYTQGTLLNAMEHVHKLVTDPAEKKMLKTVEGIGRAATRANIISTLIKRSLLTVSKKTLFPSDTACMLVNVVNKHLTDPGLTARWEQALDAVAVGKLPLQNFQQKQEQWVQQLIASAAATPLPPAPPSATPAAGASGSGSGGTRSVAGSGKPAAKGKSGSGKICPKCGKPMAERTVKAGPSAGKKFLGCTGYPQCTHSEWPNK